jgi:integrase
LFLAAACRRTGRAGSPTLDLGIDHLHDRGRWKSNRAENSHGIAEQMIIRVVQAKGRKDRNVMLPAEILDLLRQWWKARPTKRDAGVAREQRWLFLTYLKPD